MDSISLIVAAGSYSGDNLYALAALPVPVAPARAALAIPVNDAIAVSAVAPTTPLLGANVNLLA